MTRSIRSFDEGFESGFVRGEAFALQQVVGHLRGRDEWKEAADLIDKFWEEKMRAVKEFDDRQYGEAGSA